MNPRRIVVALSAMAVAGASLLVALPGAAQAEATVNVSSASKSGATATVSGVATFAPITAPESVGGTDTDWAQADVAAQAGIDMTDAKIVPLADGSGLRFSWHLSSMPAQVPPEAVRYTWSFKIGNTQYQLQAKRTNMASITTAENPIGHVKQLASQQPFFQLRGACVDSYEGTPTAGCYHLAFLTGNLDTANKTVSIDLPYNTRDNIGRLVAPDFKPGAVLVENQTAAMSIASAFQAVVGNTSTSDFINGWSPYFVGPQVSLAVGPADVDLSDPEALAFGPNLTLNPNGTFSGTINGVSGGNNTVYVRACNGETCAFDSVAL
jgi:hypothetical protein